MMRRMANEAGVAEDPSRSAGGLRAQQGEGGGRAWGSKLTRTLTPGLALAAFLFGLGAPTEADAQEIQITGPLAGAPAVRKLRKHRDGKLEFAPGVAFTLLDEYQRTMLPGGRLTYHVNDWLGFGVWGGFGMSTPTSFSAELQQKAVDGRNCADPANQSSKACRLTAGNITRGNLAQDQLGQIQWVAAPQVTVVPFRGKINLFGSFVADTDVAAFAGPALVGLAERASCGKDENGAKLIACELPKSFKLESRTAFAPTFGVSANLYPTSFVGLSAEWRAVPMMRNTSGFDTAGGGPGGDFPDTAVNANDRSLQFTNMMSINLIVQLPPGERLSD